MNNFPQNQAQFDELKAFHNFADDAEFVKFLMNFMPLCNLQLTPNQCTMLLRVLTIHENEYDEHNMSKSIQNMINKELLKHQY